jgi:hypothetical protein
MSRGSYEMRINWLRAEPTARNDKVPRPSRSSERDLGRRSGVGALAVVRALLLTTPSLIAALSHLSPPYPPGEPERAHQVYAE